MKYIRHKTQGKSLRLKMVTKWSIMNYYCYGID